MMRQLLEERFQLKIHREAKETPVYELVVAKSALHLPEAKTACLTPQEMPVSAPPDEPRPPNCFAARLNDNGFTLLGSSMANFCYVINARVLPKLLGSVKLVDKTGVGGRFDFNLKFSLDPEAADSNAPRANPSGLSRYFEPMEMALRKVGLPAHFSQGEQ